MVSAPPIKKKPDENPSENGRSARSRATRQNVIKTATKLMVEKGIESVSVVAVARESGITRAGAYYHFKNLDALLDAVRTETDRNLVRTVSGGKEDKYLYSQAAELTAEDQDMIYLRIHRMLDECMKDIIISSRQRSFERLKRENQLQPGIHAEMGAIISSTSIIASYLAVSQVKTKKRKHQVASLFGKTNYQLLFFGVLEPDRLKDWPELPKYSTSGAGHTEISSRLPPTNLKKAKSLETRELLMQATMRLMAEVGEDAVTVSQAARRAGVTRPGAYYHFKKKDDLIAAVEKKLDQELLYTLDRSFAQRESFQDATDINTIDVSLLKLRIQQMLKKGANNDPLISYHRKIFKWHQKNGHLKSDVDPDMCAIITATASLVGAYFVVSESDTQQGRARLTKKFRKAYRTYVFDGIFVTESAKDWPPQPEVDAP